MSNQDKQDLITYLNSKIAEANVNKSSPRLDGYARAEAYGAVGAYFDILHSVKLIKDTKVCEIIKESDYLSPQETDCDEFNDYLVCTNCSHRFRYFYYARERLDHGLHYCPNCGAKTIKREEKK